MAYKSRHAVFGPNHANLPRNAPFAAPTLKDNAHRKVRMTLSIKHWTELSVKKLLYVLAHSAFWYVVPAAGFEPARYS